MTEINIKEIVENLIDTFLNAGKISLELRKKGLIKEYYYDNFSNVVIFDFFLISIYLAFGLYIIQLLKTKTLVYQTIIIILTTILISGGFAFYFLNIPKNKTFFSRWFYSVRYLAVVYDIILIVSVFLIYTYLKKLI